MSTVHVNREGEAKFIAAMTNEELLKTIQDFAQPLVEINKRIDVKEQPRSKLSKLSYGEPEKIDPDKYQSLMLMTQLKIAPYVIEASLRGAEGLRDVLKEVFGGREDRDESAPKPGRRNMTREQHRLVTQAAAMRGQDESLLALPAWVSQDGIDTPKAHEVIIDVDPED